MMLGVAMAVGACADAAFAKVTPDEAAKLGRELTPVGAEKAGSKDGSIPDLVHAHPNETVADAVHYLREFHVSQMPVVRAEPPVMAAEVAGAVVERDLLDALFTGRAQLSDRLDKHMSDPLPTIGAGVALEPAMEAFAEADAALVLVDGKPAGVVTRSDVLAFLGSGG